MLRIMAWISLCSLLLLGVWDMVRPSTAFACSCAYMPSVDNLQERMGPKSAVFAGKVVHMVKQEQGVFVRTDSPVKVVFEVDRVWKGSLGPQVTVYTALHSSSCGYEGFIEERSFLVFAHESDGHLETTTCEGTQAYPVIPDAKILKALGAGYAPDPDIIDEQVKFMQMIRGMVTAPITEIDSKTYITVISAFLGFALLTAVLILIRLRRR